ncbi:MAG TPA: thioesterase family protein [Solirubrobacterales bacterium]|nr:thioesterase family protein [Solirubrobacterales bacterium]
MSEERQSRDDYPHFLALQTRWNDNDVYGHVNNVEYYGYFDTVINEWLINQGGLDIEGDGEAIGVCAESHCSYREALSFPDKLDAGLRVGKLGTSSVRYEIGIFRSGEHEAGASGWFVHVFVDPASREPRPIPEGIRSSLERLVVEGEPE